MDVLQGLARRGRAWADEAACSFPPYDRWNWTIEPSGERLSPASPARLIAVCATCPVRRDCLLDALNEAEYEVVGVLGGTTTLERRRARGLRRGDWEMQHPAARARIAEEAADKLEASLAERLLGWRERAHALAAERAAVIATS